MARQKKVSLSGRHPDISRISTQYEETTNAINLYFSTDNLNFNKLFLGWTIQEVQQRKNTVQQENELALSLMLLSALEARFRIDYIARNTLKLKDELSRAFREMAKAKGNRVSLEDEILEYWKAYSEVNNHLIGQVKSAFLYRHWLAHGRYWVPKLAQPYDFYSLQTLCELVMDTFDLQH
ncbi:hypothetical protein [Psychrobacter sp. I-STPA10]|uniref:hypothetical protein n=1 Tax=Psychrobacter sp. I-STPA10 TaxID=2585769 RepID=UPI001E5D003D|nr:hypothetical protein [Psychrobacter sp. I-STPA10]